MTEGEEGEGKQEIFELCEFISPASLPLLNSDTVSFLQLPFKANETSECLSPGQSTSKSQESLVANYISQTQ